MTERGLYENCLIELNKVEAPTLLVEDFNYYANKAVQQYMNKVYNRYDINQQSSDDLRVLKASAEITLEKDKPDSDREIPLPSRIAKIYKGVIPADYVHILNCIVYYELAKNYKCYKKGDYIEFAAKRLTADLASGIMSNVYMRPSFNRPYFYINNVNTSKVASLADDGNVNLRYAKIDDEGNIVPNSEVHLAATNHEMDESIITLKDCDTTNPDGNRVANPSDVNIEIRFGNDDSVFVPKYAYIDYIKAPMFIKLTYDDITKADDNTRVLEFPDYVCYEIVNELVKLLMENTSDPRLQTNYTINQTIADPTAVAKS